jgi:competence protein ComEA
VKPFRKIVAELLGFDRRERRGTYVLAVMLIVLLLVRVLAFRPEKELLDDDITADPQYATQSVAKADSNATVLFTFDPNTVSPGDLLSLGLSERQATTLINYRSSGARFRRPDDLKKVYGIDSVTASRLIPWIVIAEDKGRDRTVRQGTMSDMVKDAEATVSALPLIDLNRCTASDLVRLPGIGPVLSERIIRYRGLLGGYVDTGQLYEVYGLDSTVVGLISEMLTLTYDSVVPLMLDSCSFGAMARHPYIGSATAGLIARYRVLMDGPVTLGAMVRQRVMSPEQALRLAPYVRPSPEAAGEEYEFILSKVLK